MQKLYIVRLTDQERNEIQSVVKKLKESVKGFGVLRGPNRLLFSVGEQTENCGREQQLSPDDTCRPIPRTQDDGPMRYRTASIAFRSILSERAVRGQ